MSLRIIFIIIFSNIWSFVEGQHSFPIGEITDVRDGKIYQTIKIDNTIWLTENMQYKTEKADIIFKNDFGIKTDAYYYPYEEADNVCPAAFRIPKESEWEKYVQFLIELKNIPETSIKYFNIKHAKGIIHASNKLQFFDEPNPLNLEVSGITQGANLISDGSLSFWCRKDESTDFKYHLHILADGYSNHTHKRHITTRKKKIRKFVVRCVMSDL